MKKVIRLTERELRGLVTDVVREALARGSEPKDGAEAEEIKRSIRSLRGKIDRYAEDGRDTSALDDELGSLKNKLEQLC